MNQYIIKLCKDEKDAYSLIADSYLTTENNLGVDIQKILMNNTFTYGLPVYIKIIAMQDRTNIPEYKK